MGTVSLCMHITRTWGQYESEQMAGFTYALLLSGVPDYDVSRTIGEARFGLDLGPIAMLPRPTPIARPPSMGMTLPPLRPVPVGPPAAKEPPAPVLASSTPGPDIALCGAGMANPNVWVTILSSMCRRAPAVELKESAIAAIAAVFAELANRETVEGRGSVAKAIGLSSP